MSSKTKKPLVILHGYSDRSDSFQPLAKYLKAHNFKVVDLWLADYISMQDEITIHDLGLAMGKAIRANGIPQDPKSFDVIVHSTGGLVVRAYLNHYFYGRPNQCPIHRLLMLAPANFGSPLAALGKSMLGRLTKGWKWDGFFQTGTRVLEALELASPISWELARRDLFNPDNPLFRTSHLFTTILIGSAPYEGKQGWIHENGSDGTVRVSTANLNARYYQLKLSEPEQVDFKEIKPQYDPVAFGVVYGHNHGSITRPESNNWDAIAPTILKSLGIETKKEYEEHVKRLRWMTDETFTQGEARDQQRGHYHQYQTINTRVHDQFGELVTDYFIELYQEAEERSDKVMEKIHTEILEKVRPFSLSASHRSFLFDFTDMAEMIFKKMETVDMHLTVASKSKQIYYCDPEPMTVYSPKDKINLFQPNISTFIDIQIERIQHESLFRLKKV